MYNNKHLVGRGKLRVIMLSGYKRSGKDFVAQRLHEMIDGSIVMSFAEPLKDIIATTLDIGLVELDRQKNEPNEFLESAYLGGEGFSTTVRGMLQRFGTEAMKKHFGDNVWADLLVSKLPLSGVVIISDWRFPPEVEALSKVADVTTVRIVDKNLTGDGHSSESALDNYGFDVHIDNTDKNESVQYALNSFVTVW